jgi:hypothetical protein
MEGLQPRSDGYVVDALEFAAALTDEDLMPVAVWIVGSNCATIEDIDPSEVECRGPITQWLYEDEFKTRPAGYAPPTGVGSTVVGSPLPTVQSKGTHGEREQQRKPGRWEET